MVQKVLMYISAIVAGFLALGAVLDAIVNAISIITPMIAVTGTVLISLSWIITHLWLKSNPLNWTTGQTTVKIKKLGWKTNLFIVGMVLLLWLSLIINNFKDTNEKPISEIFTYQVHILDYKTNTPVSNAKVTISIHNLRPLDAFTDLNGMAKLAIDPQYEGFSGLLIVTADGYEEYQQNLDMILNTLPNIILLKSQIIDAPHPVSTTPQIAFLQDGNIRLSEVPDGTQIKLSNTRDIISFVWSFDGTQIATFNGHGICFLELTDSSPLPCIELNIPDNQLDLYKQIIWSPDRRYFVLWSGNNFQRHDDGWLIVDRTNPEQSLHITNPFDWGMRLSDWDMTAQEEFKGFMGEPVFLRDNTLIGTVGNEGSCGSGGCWYKLFKFNLETRKFSPLLSPETQFFQEGEDLAISANGKVLINVGTFCAGAAFCTTYYGVIYLDGEVGFSKSFENDLSVSEYFSEPTISPDGVFVVIGYNGRQPNQTVFCGSSTNSSPMQLLDLRTNERTILLPGNNPRWAYNGKYLTFESCMKLQDGKWIFSSTAPLQVFVTDLTTLDFQTVSISEGISPSWRP